MPISHERTFAIPCRNTEIEPAADSVPAAGDELWRAIRQFCATLGEPGVKAIDISADIERDGRLVLHVKVQISERTRSNREIHLMEERP